MVNYYIECKDDIECMRSFDFVLRTMRQNKIKNITDDKKALVITAGQARIYFVRSRAIDSFLKGFDLWNEPIQVYESSIMKWRDA